MRLKVSRNAAEERLVVLLTEGYQLRLALNHDYRGRVAGNVFNKLVDIQRYREAFIEWATKIELGLKEIFPTDLELLVFLSPYSHTAVAFTGIDQDFALIFHQNFPLYLSRLKAILDADLHKYTDLPVQERLHVEDVDSFQKVRDVNPSMVAGHLTNGYLAMAEDTIQMALEAILGVADRKSVV